MATKAGEQALQAAREGKAQPAWGAPVEISQTQAAQPGGIPAPAVTAAFHVSTAKLPALAGVDLPDQGYAIVAVNSVTSAQADTEQLRAQQGTMNQLLSQAVTDAYIDSLKKRYGVEVLYKLPEQANS